MNDFLTEGFFLVRNGQSKDAFEKKKFKIILPKDNEVLIEVEAFGLNYADIMARRGLYRDAPSLPCIIGYEVVGTIIRIGPKVNKSKLGQRVIAFCRFGGYAKHVITYEYATVIVGDQQASSLMGLCTQGVTAFYMSESLISVNKLDKVLIHSAAGGVGSILIQLVKLKGAYVIAKVGSREKESLVKELGADFVVNYNKGDYIKKIKEKFSHSSLDIVFNPIGGKTFKRDFSLLGSGGRIVLFGAADLSKGKMGILSKLNFLFNMGFVLPISLMIKSKNILGVNMLKIADDKPEVLLFCLQEISKLYLEGKIKPQVGGLYNANQLAEAHDALEGGKTTGKLVVTW